jgi:hypothetical protein
MDKEENFGTPENPNYSKLTGMIFPILKEYQEYFKGTAGYYKLDFSTGVRYEEGEEQKYKKNNLWRFNAGHIKKSKEAKNVLGYTYVPSFRIFDEDAGKLEIFLLGPKQGTGFFRKDEKEDNDRWKGYSSNPIRKINDFEVLLPFGTATQEHFFPFLIGLNQNIEDDSGIFGDDSYCTIGRRDYKLNELINSSKSYWIRTPDERPGAYITRGYLPNGERFGIKSSINNNTDYMQMFGLIRVNSNDKNKRGFMGWAMSVGKIPCLDRGLTSEILSKDKSVKEIIKN